MLNTKLLALFVLACGLQCSLALTNLNANASETESVVSVDSPPGINPNPTILPDSKCTEAPKSGNGSAQMTRFYFDAPNQMCRQFEYSGDGGNENNFETELDCLNDCYTGVSEGVPVREEDVVFIGDGAPSAEEAVASCSLPKDQGNCTGAVQAFYFLPKWQSCVAFVYSGCGGNQNRFESRAECEQTCLVQDGSVCRGPSNALEAVSLGPDCRNTVCPVGSTCTMGLHKPECCRTDEHQLFLLANAQTCENGARAGGRFGEYFAATFALDCTDLICGAGSKCVMHSRAGAGGFAKCCKEAGGQPQKPTKKIKPRMFSEIRV